MAILYNLSVKCIANHLHLKMMLEVYNLYNVYNYLQVYQVYIKYLCE